MRPIPSLNDISPSIELCKNYDEEFGEAIRRAVYTDPVSNEKLNVMLKVCMDPLRPAKEPFDWLDDYDRVRKRLAELHVFAHTNLAPVLGIYPDGETVSVVYRYYGKGTLLSYLENYPQVSRLDQVIQVAKCLEHLHRNDLVCGDISPPHILVMDDGTLVVTYVRLPPYRPDLRRKEIRPYAAPEMWRNVRSDTASDILKYEADMASAQTDVFSFGLTAVHLLSGKPPVGRDSKEHVSGDNVLVRTDYANIPDEVWNALEPCWKQTAAGRPTISDLLRSLESARNESSSST